MRISNRLARRGRGRGTSRRHAIWSPRLIAVGAVLACATAACGGTTTPEPTSTPRPAVVTSVVPVTRLRSPATADAVFTALNAAGLRLTPSNAGGKGKGGLVKRIVATYADWPLIISQYRSVSALAKATGWKAGSKPGQGESPVALKGMNILVEWGPTTGARPPKPSSRQRTALAALIKAMDGLASPLQTRSIIKVTLPSHAAPTPAPSSTATDTPGAGGPIGVSPSPREITGP
jgi:hypothetical protein